MTSASRKLQSILMTTAVAVGLGLSAPAGAEELRIGYLAPLTGGLAQTGIDMRDGFLLYLEQHGNKLGGMDVKLIIEDEQGKGDVAVTKAKKLVLQDKVHMLIGGVLASTGYALAPVSTELKTMYIPSIPAADDLTQRQLKDFPYPPAGRARNPTTRSANGPATRAIRRSSRSPLTTHSATRPSAASRRRSRIAVARSSRRSGLRSAPRISGRLSRRSKGTPTQCSH
jgi:hypothetical protein